MAAMIPGHDRRDPDVHRVIMELLAMGIKADRTTTGKEIRLTMSHPTGLVVRYASLGQAVAVGRQMLEAAK